MHNFPRGVADVDPDFDAVSLIGLGLLGNRKEAKNWSSLNRNKNRVGNFIIEYFNLSGFCSYCSSGTSDSWPVA